LALVVQETLAQSPQRPSVRVPLPTGRPIKVLCLFAKRLEHSRFVWPSTVTREGIDRISTTGQINFCVPEPILRPSVVIEGQTLGSGL
jgi:hypothetical protein